jgi:hypothetical protein
MTVFRTYLSAVLLILRRSDVLLPSTPIHLKCTWSSSKSARWAPSFPNPLCDCHVCGSWSQAELVVGGDRRLASDFAKVAQAKGAKLQNYGAWKMHPSGPELTGFNYSSLLGEGHAPPRGPSPTIQRPLTALSQRGRTDV